MSTPRRPATPRDVACPRCRAGAYQACKTTKPGSIRVVFLKGFHAERKAALRESQVAFDANTDA